LIVREATFALRVVRRRAGDAAILYRRSLNAKRQERLTKVTSISPLAFTAGLPLLRAGVKESTDSSARLRSGPFYPLDPDWGARIACYARVASGLRRADKLAVAASHLREADAAEASWWFALMSRHDGRRAVRALRVLTEATS
jgi:hypothetical protein